MPNLFNEDDNQKEKPETTGIIEPEEDFQEPESFEAAMEQLEALVQKLESGSVELQESIVIYKQARKLAAWCYQKLTAFQGELKTLGLTEEGEFSLDDLPPVE